MVNSSSETTGSTATPAHRVILLGASNLTRGISTVVETARLSWGTPLDVMSALGHGRSYGKPSRVLGRSLPAIVDCGLWHDLAARPAMRTASLITDVGNDLLLGASPSHVATWIDQCLERLAPVTDSLVITELPLANIAHLSNARFRLFRTILFPRSELTLSEVSHKAKDLNEQLLQLASRYKAQVVQPVREWYGIDPIHIKMRHWPTAWAQIMKPWSQKSLTHLASGSFSRWLSLRCLPPHYRKLFCCIQRKQQPASTLRDGSHISFY